MPIRSNRLWLAALFTLALASSASAIWPFSRPSYTLTVVNGSGSGSYKAGTVIPILATPRTDGEFAAWLSAGPAWGTRPMDFADPNAAATSFTMPKHDETIQATYRLLDSVVP